MLAGEKALAEWKAEGAKVQEGIKAPYQEFYNDAVNEFLFNIEENRDFVVDAYRKWRKDQEKEQRILRQAWIQIGCLTRTSATLSSYRQLQNLWS